MRGRAALGGIASFLVVEPVKRERRVRERSEGQRKKRPLVIVAGDAVGAQSAAARAAMDQRPFAVGTHFDGDGLHRFAARRATIAGRLIKVSRPEASRAVVAVFGSESGVRNGSAALHAIKAARRATAVLGHLVW